MAPHLRPGPDLPIFINSNEVDGENGFGGNIREAEEAGVRRKVIWSRISFDRDGGRRRLCAYRRKFLVVKPRNFARADRNAYGDGGVHI